MHLRDDPHLADDVMFGSSGDLAVDIAADRIGGRVGADPSAILKPPARSGNGQSPTAATAAG